VFHREFRRLITIACRHASSYYSRNPPLEEANCLMHSVLVIDDDESLRTLIRRWIDSSGFRAREANSAEEALFAMEREVADIALCDVKMGGRDGIWLASQIRDLYPNTAIVMATGQHDMDSVAACLRNDVVDYLLKPFDRRRLVEAITLARDWHTAATGVEALQTQLQDRIRSRRASIAVELADAQATEVGAVDTLVAMLQLHDRDGRGHATRVARLAVALGEELGFADAMLDALEQGALLHDIGKLNMPPAILSKPAPLDDAEWRVMRTHPQAGYDLIKDQPRFAAAADIVLAHHEAWDGSGYPRRLTGDEIPLGARVLAVADAYDSMTQPHTQRPALPPALAVQEIERCRGRQFDPQCAEALGTVLAEAGKERIA
jgi:putative two-component system response regulator